MVEEWRDIDGFEGFYQVSNIGRVRSLDRIIKYRDGRNIRRSGKIMKPFVNSSGYLQCHFSINGVGEKYPYIHKLVAEAFIDNPLNLDEANHIDHNKLNCNIDNLEWVTHKENMDKRFEFYGNRIEKNYCIDCNKEIYYKSTRCIKCNNKLNPSVKVSIEDRPSKEELLELLKNNSFLKVGRMYGVSDNAIRRWCLGYEIPSKASYYKNL